VNNMEGLRKKPKEGGNKEECQGASDALKYLPPPPENGTRRKKRKGREGKGAVEEAVVVIPVIYYPTDKKGRGKGDTRRKKVEGRTQSLRAV